MKWLRLESDNGLSLTSLRGNFNCQLLKDAPALVNQFSQYLDQIIFPFKDLIETTMQFKYFLFELFEFCTSSLTADLNLLLRTNEVWCHIVCTVQREVYILLSHWRSITWNTFHIIYYGIWKLQFIIYIRKIQTYK